MIVETGNSDCFIPSIPFYFAGILLIWSLFRKSKCINSLILSISFSSIAFVFLFFKNQISGIGNSLVGFEIAMYASPFITVPLAGLGWYLGRTFNYLKTFFISIIVLCLYFALAYSYQAMIMNNFQKLKLSSEINCSEFPFHCAVKNNDLIKIPKIKSSGFNIEARESKTGLTALWMAINNEEATKVLLENGANPNSINRQNETPLAQVLAISTKANYRIAELLLNHGALINQKIGVSKKMTILNIQIINKNLEAIRFSLDHGADPKLIDDYGKDACERFKKMKLVDKTISNQLCNSL